MTPSLSSVPFNVASLPTIERSIKMFSPFRSTFPTFGAGGGVTDARPGFAAALLGLPALGGPVRADEAPAGVEVQARGPVHEAYAEPTELRPTPSVVVNRKPPDPIPERAQHPCFRKTGAAARRCPDETPQSSSSCRAE